MDKNAEKGKAMRNKYKIVIGFMLLCVMVGCIKEKHKTLVSAHTVVGELLITTKDQAVLLHNQKVISDSTYESVRINWLRAQEIYIKASGLLEAVISSGKGDASMYLQMLTQTNNILMDITRWLQEESGGVK